MFDQPVDEGKGVTVRQQIEDLLMVAEEWPARDGQRLSGQVDLCAGPPPERVCSPWESAEGKTPELGQSPPIRQMPSRSSSFMAARRLLANRSGGFKPCWPSQTRALLEVGRRLESRPAF